MGNYYRFLLKAEIGKDWGLGEGKKITEKCSKRKSVKNGVVVRTDTLADAIVETPVKGLHFLPAGHIPPKPSELIGSKVMKRFLANLQEKYEIILIDTPLLTAVTDAVALSQFVDGVMLVVRTGTTPRQVVKNSLEQLQAVKANIFGVVLNAFSSGKGSYYYSQYYYSYYGEDGDRKKRRAKAKRPAGSHA